MSKISKKGTAQSMLQRDTVDKVSERQMGEDLEGNQQK